MNDIDNPVSNIAGNELSTLECHQSGNDCKMEIKQEVDDEMPPRCESPHNIPFPDDTIFSPLLLPSLEPDNIGSCDGEMMPVLGAEEVIKDEEPEGVTEEQPTPGAKDHVYVSSGVSPPTKKRGKKVPVAQMGAGALQKTLHLAGFLKNSTNVPYQMCSLCKAEFWPIAIENIKKHFLLYHHDLVSSWEVTLHSNNKSVKKSKKAKLKKKCKECPLCPFSAVSIAGLRFHVTRKHKALLKTDTDETILGAVPRDSGDPQSFISKAVSYKAIVCCPEDRLKCELCQAEFAREEKDVYDHFVENHNKIISEWQTSDVEEDLECDSDTSIPPDEKGGCKDPDFCPDDGDDDHDCPDSADDDDNFPDNADDDYDKPKKPKKPVVKKMKVRKCSECDFTSLCSSLELKRHYRANHSNLIPTIKKICDQCGISLTESGFRRHRYKHMTPTLQCESCPQMFHIQTHLKQHELKYHAEKTIECGMDGCGEMFATIALMEKHVRKTHPTNVYTCPVEGCGYRHASERRVKNHYQRYHTNERPFACNICDKRFITTYHLGIHKRIHSDEKPAKCPYCDYSGRQKAALRWHLLHQHKDKPEGQLKIQKTLRLNKLGRKKREGEKKKVAKRKEVEKKEVEKKKVAKKDNAKKKVAKKEVKKKNVIEKKKAVEKIRERRVGKRRVKSR